MNPAPACDMQAFHEQCLIAVTHDHRPIGDDLPRMLAGGVTAKVYQVTLDVDVEAGYEASRTRTEGWLRLAASGMDDALRDIEDHPDRCLLARTVTDIVRAKEHGIAAILLGSEGTRWLEGSLEPLRLFHRLGLRELQLTWAFPNAVVPDGHLSAFGKAVVQECERLGILVDLTHCPSQAFFEVVRIARKPLIVSHGSARGVTTDLADEHIRALAQSGGLLGIHFYTTYLGPNAAPDDVFRQVDYVAQLVGIDHVALGVDFFPTEGPWYDLQVAQGTRNLRWAVPDFSRMPEMTQCLCLHGYHQDAIRKVLGLNFLRVCREVFG
ncbi:MAG: membrane dipeptidase [Planctomycetes bacterium]|nr:membrane dipeptidase [Planctomycetota bacterium]